MTPSSATEDRPRVLILGGGFAGIGAARKLKDAPADVVLVDGHDYHTFQPLLYQVATDLLEPAEVAHPLRDLFHDQPNARVHQAAATSIDLEARRVEFDRMDPIDYDYLVIALGAQVSFFGVDGASDHAFPMYTLEDALRLKEHVLRRWEAADRDPSLVEDGALRIVVVGGGPTGVESVGALAELYHSDFAKDYPSLPAEHAKLTIVEAGEDLFSMFEPELRSYTQKTLEKRGVEVMLGEIVSAVEPTRVTLKSGQVLNTHTLVWGAGLVAHPITQSLGVKLERGDRIPVGPDLSVEGHPEAFAVGDVAWISDAESGKPLPQLGSVALQAGERAGESIARLLDGGTHRAVRLPRQGDDGDDRPRRGRDPVPQGADDEGEDCVPGVGRGSPRAPLDR